MASLPFAGDDRRDGVVGLAFAMKNIAQLLLMCDGHDIGLSVDGGSLERSTRTGGIGGVPEALAAEPNIFIYDNYPGGIGFSRPLFEMHALLLERTRELIAGCPCESGCPSCVGPEGNTGPASPKQVASRILDRLLSQARGRLMDLSSRLRAIVKSGPSQADLACPERGSRSRELTYEPDTGGYEATIDLDRVGAILGGRAVGNAVRPVPGRRSPLRGGSLARRAIRDRRLRRRGLRIRLAILDPASDPDGGRTGAQTPDGQLHTARRTIFIDLETTGLSGGAGTVAFLVGCGYFDLGAFQVRQFLLTSYASERALLYAVAEFFEGARSDRHLQRQDVRRAGDGDALAVPSPADAARRRAAFRHAAPGAAAVARATAQGGRRRTADAGCRRWSATLFNVTPRRRRRRVRDSGALLSVPAQRRSASARTGARTQSARSRVAGGGDGARGAAGARTATRRAATAERRWRSAVSTSGLRRTSGCRSRRAWRRAPRAVTGAPRSRRAAEVRGGSAISAGAAASPRTAVRGSGGALAGGHRADRAARRAARSPDWRRCGGSRSRRSRSITNIAIAT